jgi:hypothetical protein
VQYSLPHQIEGRDGSFQPDNLGIPCQQGGGKVPISPRSLVTLSLWNRVGQLPNRLPSIPSVETTPLHEQVYQRIVQAIMTGHFQPGQKLTYRGVAQFLGTSDMPVRSAVRRLISLRALTLLPNGSVVVPLLDATSFSNLMDTRIQLEGWALELAFPPPLWRKRPKTGINALIYNRNSVEKLSRFSQT